MTASPQTVLDLVQQALDLSLGWADEATGEVVVLMFVRSHDGLYHALSPVQVTAPEMLSRLVMQRTVTDAIPAAPGAGG